MSKAMETYFTVMFCVVVFFGFAFGFIKLIQYKNSESVKDCKENVAQIGNYEATYKGGYCMFVRDGKLEEAK